MNSLQRLSKFANIMLSMYLGLVLTYDGGEIAHSRNYPSFKKTVSQDSGFDSSSSEEENLNRANPCKIEGSEKVKFSEKSILFQNFYLLKPEFLELSVKFKSTDKEVKLVNSKLDSIPEFITEKMVALQTLDLSLNQYLLFPSDFGVIKKTLRILKLKGCKLTIDQISMILNQFERLEELDVSENPDLKFPKNLGKVAGTLKKLNVSKTNMKFEDLKRLKFKNLRVLIFDNNNLNDIPEDYIFPNFNGNLKRLSAVGCQITYQGLISITKLQLEHLDISHNCFNKTKLEEASEYKAIASGLLPEKYNYTGIINWFKKIKKNWILGYDVASRFSANSLVANDFMNWIRKSEIDESFTIGNLAESLVSLKMRYCLLDSKILSYFIKNLKKLKRLDIYGNNLRNLNDQYDFYRLTETLEELDVGWCNINSYSLLLFKQLKNLKKFNLEMNHFSDIEEWLSTPESLIEYKMPKIEILEVENCALTERGLECLSKVFPNVKVLNVSQNQFTETIKLSSEWKESIQTLKMVQCRVSEAVLKEVLTLSKLNSLDIQSNDLELFTLKGVEGDTIKNLKILKIGGISSNLINFEVLRLFKMKKLFISHLSISEVNKPLADATFKKFNQTLEKLEIKYTSVSNEFIEIIGQLEKLKYLGLYEVDCRHLSKSCFEAPNFKNLKILDSRGCEFSFEAIQALLKLNYKALYLFRHHGY